MARWEVTAKVVGTKGVVEATDVEDRDDVRAFDIDHLERVSGGQEEVVGYAYVDEDSHAVADSWTDESYVDDPYDDADEGVEYPSLFDDPIALQLEEDRADPDFVSGEDE